MPTGSTNTFGLHQFDYKESFFSGRPILSQGEGYGLVLGYGAFFAVLTVGMMWFDRRYGGVKDNSEEFNTAGRSVKLGLAAVDIVSRSTWVTSLLLSGNYAYIYGFSGAFWSGVSFPQVFLFGIVALTLKRKAPKAHTVIELVYLRWGKYASFVLLYACLLNNIFNGILLVIAFGNVISAITGINIYGTLVLVPMGVIVYTYSGGLKATYLSSYVHTIVIFVTINIFAYVVFASDKVPIGSIRKVWENLKVMSTVVPVQNNKGGSYLTMFSLGGFEYGLLNCLASFTVFSDQAYWQGAIAATPKAAFRSCILGGLLYTVVPLIFALALGLGAVAVDLPISQGEFNAGLVTVAAAEFILGKGGVILMLTILFMSVTSSGSAEFIAMSSLLTYDVYKRFLRPKATNEEMLVVSRAAVVVIGMLIAGLSCLCKAVGIDVTFLYFVGGLIVSSSFPPLAFLLIWARVPAGACIASVLIGQVLSTAAWLVHAQLEYGRLTVSDTLQRVGPTLDGTVVALVTSTAICVIWTLIAPDKRDAFAEWKSIQVMDDVEILDVPKEDLPQKHLIFQKYTLTAIALSVFWMIIWPLLTLPAGIFSEQYFAFWVVIAFILTSVASIIGVFYPMFESRKDILNILVGAVTRCLQKFRVRTS